MKPIIEYLSTKIKTLDVSNKEKTEDNPYSWEVGDILWGQYSYSSIIPYFYKIYEKTAKTFTLVRLDEKIVSGTYNGSYEVIAVDRKLSDTDEKRKVKINKYGNVRIGSGYSSVTLYLWDGKTPISGFRD